MKEELSRVTIRNLNEVQVDLQRYLGWLQNVGDNSFITSARPDYKMSELNLYLKEKLEKQDVLFWGIFLGDLEFIGTIKLDPINLVEKSAWMGMMIGSPSDRGKGFGKQALLQVIHYAKDELGLSKIYLGVHQENIPAIRLYRGLGFQTHHHSGNSLTMFLSLNEFIES